MTQECCRSRINHHFKTVFLVMVGEKPKAFMNRFRMKASCPMVDTIGGWLPRPPG